MLRTNLKKASALVATATLIAIASLASTSSADAKPVPSVACAAGKAVITGTGGWTVNGAGPWAWDQGTGPATFAGCDAAKHCASATMTGSKCAGTITAYLCNASSCTQVKVDVK